MNIYQAYKYCPRCSGEFEHKGKNLLQCSQCKFKLFVMPSLAINAIIEENGQILLVERKNEPNKGTYDLPGGYIEPNEDPMDAIKRELHEELHIVGEVQKIISILPDIYPYQGIDSPTLGICVLVKRISGEIKPDDDAKSYKFFDKETILEENIGFESIKKALKIYLTQ